MRFLLYFTIFLATFHENPLFHFTPYRYCLQRTLCSDFRNQLLFLFYENRPAKAQFQIGPFSTNTRPEKSRTPPDRSATPYYVESFRFQPGFIERKFKILKVLSKTLSWSQFSGLTAANKNNALLILWNPNNCETCKNQKDAQPNFLQENVLNTSPSFF